MIFGYGFLRHSHRFGGIVHRKVQRVWPVNHVSANHNPATRFPIGFQANVQVRSAAGVNEGGGAIFQQLRDGQQRSGVLIGIRHRSLQAEDVGQVLGAQIIWEQPARGVGVADMHMAIDETGSHNHTTAIDHRIGPHTREFGSFTNFRDTVPRDHHAAISDDAPLWIHGDDVTHAVDLDGRFGHIMHL